MVQSKLSTCYVKNVLKSYWKRENAAEVRRRFRRDFHTDPPSRLTAKRIRNNSEAAGTVQNVRKLSSSRPESPSDADTKERALKMHRLLRPRT
ncbi:hypothetical protein AVEN_96545-1 [Araneus ventricosus]|uniref:DUF4817 domain-containing protein n=1 Tax=Araneus ventricosus TaxID=182803 RepID=A0A4Y2UEJ8_ARAVE|nr:hypothetical protein AVEN_96545-1 [Araneus ventricosus]